MNKLTILANSFKQKLAQMPVQNKAAMLKDKISTTLLALLGNKSWDGEVGFNSLTVTEQDDRTVVNYNILLPSNAPPFTNKMKYPSGLNQFKQEVMHAVSQLTDSLDIQNVVQTIQVNGQ